MPWPEVKLTARLPLARKRRGAALRRMFPLAFDGDFLLAEHVKFALRVGLLVNLAALRRGRDGVKDAAFGDARLHVLRDELVAVAGDADAGIFRRAPGGLSRMARASFGDGWLAHTNYYVGPTLFFLPPVNPEVWALSGLLTGCPGKITRFGPKTQRKRKGNFEPLCHLPWSFRTIAIFRLEISLIFGRFAPLPRFVSVEKINPLANRRMSRAPDGVK